MLAFTSCVYVGYNSVHDNRKNVLVPAPAGAQAFGIALFFAPNNHIRSNVVTNNGDGFANEAGVTLINAPTTDNLVVENQSKRMSGMAWRLFRAPSTVIS